MIVLPANEDEKKLMLAWAMKEIHGTLFSEDCHVVGIQSDNKLTGIVVFSNITVTDARVSIRIKDKKAISRKTAKAVFFYAFEYLGVRRITGLIKKSNRRARRLAEKLGFKLEGTIRKASLDNKDLLVYGLLEEECAFYVRTGTALSTELH